MKIMLDTNVLISTIFFPNKSSEYFLMTLLRNTDNDVILCDYVVEELREVTLRKFPSKRDAMEIFFYELPFTLVNTVESTKHSRNARPPR